MDILFYRFESMYESPIITVFKQFGINVEEINTTFEEKSTTSSVTVEAIYQRIINHKTPFLFVFSINFFPAISEICKKLNTLYVCWSVDSPVMELFTNSICNKNNRIFLFDKAQYERFHIYNPDNIFYLPLASDIDAMQDIVSRITPADRIKYGNDISFIGSLYTNSSPLYRIKNLDDYAKGYIDALIASQMQVFGYNFSEDALTDKVVEMIKNDKIDRQPADLVACIDYYTVAQLFIARKLAEKERIRTLSELGKDFSTHLYTTSDYSDLTNVYVHGPVAPFGDAPKVYHLSKINLNITLRSIETGLPLRIFDVLACGGFLITNYQAELPELFEIGKEIEAYSSIDELKEKCAYYLSHDEERQQIAENGFRRSQEVHTCAARIKQMLSCII